MMNRTTSLAYLMLRTTALLCIAITIAGCKPASNSTVATAPGSTDVEGDHAPATFSEGLSSLATMKSNIQSAFEKSDPESAHHDLHEIGHTLDSLEKLAKTSSMAEADQVAVVAAIESLFEAYGKLDEMMHGGDEIAYKDIAGDIDAAMASLEKYAPK